jgi:hypothetical protein
MNDLELLYQPGLTNIINTSINAQFSSEVQ